MSTEPERAPNSDIERDGPQEVTRIAFSEAGLLLGKSYIQVQTMVLRGTIKGGQDENGRWYVEQPSLDEYIAAQPIRD